MAKAEMTVHLADLPTVKALVEQLRAENDRLRRALHVALPAMEILREKCVNDEARAVVQQALDLVEASLSASSETPDE